MDLYEFQAKELFAKHGVATTIGVIAETPEAARAAAEEMGGVTVIKAQVKAGGRGKAGGVKLAKTPDGDAGSMLDSSIFLYGSNMSNSDRHNNDPLPAALLGRANGRIKGGQHLKYPQDSRFADLLMTIFDRNNLPVKSIGDSGGPISEV